MSDKHPYRREFLEKIKVLESSMGQPDFPLNETAKKVLRYVIDYIALRKGITHNFYIPLSHCADECGITIGKAREGVRVLIKTGLIHKTGGVHEVDESNGLFVPEYSFTPNIEGWIKRASINRGGRPEVSATQRVKHVLSKGDGMNLGELAARTGLSRNSISVTTKRMADANEITLQVGCGGSKLVFLVNKQDPKLQLPPQPDTPAVTDKEKVSYVI